MIFIQIEKKNEKNSFDESNSKIEFNDDNFDDTNDTNDENFR